jgi:hypothetical protein
VDLPQELMHRHRVEVEEEVLPMYQDLLEPHQDKVQEQDKDLHLDKMLLHQEEEAVVVLLQQEDLLEALQVVKVLDQVVVRHQVAMQLLVVGEAVEVVLLYLGVVVILVMEPSHLAMVQVVPLQIILEMEPY